MKPKPHTEKFRAPAADWLDHEPPMISHAWDDDDADPLEDISDLAGVVRDQENDW